MTAPSRGWPALRQAAIGLALAALILSAWLVIHLYGVFLFRWSAEELLLLPILLPLQCWLSVGLFIVAHDAMHGSLAPYRPGLNRAVGRLALRLYAGFSYDRLIGKHFAHHRHSGTAQDPDFHADAASGFWPWYLGFIRAYFGWREFLTLAALLVVYVAVLGASPLNVAVFWGLPAVLSSVQLFYFGTYLPHRHEDRPFADHHRARSSELSRLGSLLSCFHFGYHHEHHAQPHVPWWRLPAVRKAPPVSPAGNRPAAAEGSGARTGPAR
ncbi:fatty acid desaturase [Enterovirga sp.]|uniref:fatty acid desaturase n=1 Tax=Enterovirga sp. TaxID=2026350 RepID=UPI002634E6E9|nr:fatty acid desaturase [Enterovirga sp.]MDB5591113.1 beta-carotene ketolase [Enterovirga sp.]